jgi:hypothetical protein
LIFIEHLLEERRSEVENGIAISDRTLVDHLAYTTYLFPEIAGTPEYVALRQCAFDSLRWYDAIFQLRVEFQIEEDGVREADIGFQLEIDRLIEHLYSESGRAAPICVTGSVLQRTRAVVEHIDALRR